MGLLWILLILVACQEDGNGTLITRQYDFILGFAVPNGDRATSTEVFVGRLKPFNPEFFDPQGFTDSFLEEQVFKFSDNYLAEVEHYDDAEVFIHSANQTVKLEHTGFGVYKDISDELEVSALEKYSLEVRRPGGLIYTDEVIVPGDVQITNFDDQDTIMVYPKATSSSSTDICLKLYPVISNQVQYAHLYQSKQSNDGPGTLPSAKYINFQHDGAAAPAIFEFGGSRTHIHFQWELIALDTTATLAYNPSGSIGLNIEEAEFLDYTRNPNNIEERSSIQVNKGRRVVGNFGSYNSTSIEFTIMAKMDSCGM